ncbi:MAG: hypothetical protein AAB967_01285, partial [Patescibacteria group bacterium]
MMKIFIGKEEEAAGVAEKIAAAQDTDVVIVVPKDAALKRSLNNFHLLKREADALKKKITIESVDGEVLALAKASGLENIHAFFKTGRTSNAFSDIVPAGGATVASPKEKREA